MNFDTKLTALEYLRKAWQDKPEPVVEELRKRIKTIDMEIAETLALVEIAEALKCRKQAASAVFTGDFTPEKIVTYIKEMASDIARLKTELVMVRMQATSALSETKVPAPISPNIC